MKNAKKRVDNKFFPEGLTFKKVGREIRVFSEKLKVDPIFDRPYIKVISKAIPETRPSINDWFQKHF